MGWINRQGRTYCFVTVAGRAFWAPWGFFGRLYEVSGVQELRALRREGRRALALLLTVLTATLLVVSVVDLSDAATNTWGFVLTVVGCGAHHLWLRRRVQRLEPGHRELSHTERVELLDSVLEYRASSLDMMGALVLIALGIVCAAWFPTVRLVAIMWIPLGFWLIRVRRRDQRIRNQHSGV